MKKKTVVQIFLSSIVIVISLTIFFKYFSEETVSIDKVVSKKETHEISNEKLNVIKNIQYLSKDETGNVYSIFAEYGEIKDQDSNIIYLKNVKAKISILNSDDINIVADNAKYNSKNYDTNFYENTKISYAQHNINCEYLDLLFNKKLAILYDSIVYKNLQTRLLADRLEIDLISKNSKIYMNDTNKKIQIVGKN